MQQVRGSVLDLPGAYFLLSSICGCVFNQGWYHGVPVGSNIRGSHTAGYGAAVEEFLGAGCVSVLREEVVTQCSGVDSEGSHFEL